LEGRLADGGDLGLEQVRVGEAVERGEGHGSRHAQAFMLHSPQRTCRQQGAAGEDRRRTFPALRCGAEDRLDAVTSVSRGDSAFAQQAGRDLQTLFEHGGAESVMALAEGGDAQVAGNQHDTVMAAVREVVHQGCHGGLVVDAHLVDVSCAGVEVREPVQQDQGLLLLADPLEQHGV
jgi:hypothetical protein